MAFFTGDFYRDPPLGSGSPDTIAATFTVANQAARYALVEGDGEDQVQADDLVRQADTGIVYLFNGGDPSQASGWDQVTGVRPVSLGGTGAANAAGARTNLDVPSNADLALRALLEDAYRYQVFRYQPAGNSSLGTSNVGGGVPTSLGTATARAYAATNLYTRANRLGFVSAGTAGSIAGYYEGTRRYNLLSTRAVCHFAISDASLVSGARLFAGFRNTASAPTDVEPNSLNHVCGVGQLSTDATQFYAILRGAGADLSVPLGTSIVPSVDRVYRVEIIADDGVDGRAEVKLTDLAAGITVTSGLVSGLSDGTGIGFRCWRSNGATASAVGIDLVDLYIRKVYL